MSLAQSLRYPERDYIAFDPFEGDRDVDVRMRTVKLVRARVDYSCWYGQSGDREPHTIKAGELHRYECALVDREYWGSYRICLPCMDKWFAEWR